MARKNRAIGLTVHHHMSGNSGKQRGPMSPRPLLIRYFMLLICSTELAVLQKGSPAFNARDTEEGQKVARKCKKELWEWAVLPPHLPSFKCMTEMSKLKS